MKPYSSNALGFVSVLGLSIALLGCSASNESAVSEAAEDTQSAPDLAVADMPGPAIGDLAPVDIVLKTASDQPAQILGESGKKGLVLVFNRSGDWCPYCQAQVKGLSTLAADIKAEGYGLAAVTYDDPALITEFSDREKISFPLFSDTGSKLIDAFGLRDPQYTEGLAVGVPYASIFVLSPDGRVLAKSVSSDYKIRPSNTEVMALLAKAG